jgi:hypothetical protein
MYLVLASSVKNYADTIGKPISTVERVVRAFGQERSELLIYMCVGHEG